MKCFIISPIGQPGTPVREHADDIFECIIAPALKEAGVAGRRADHIKDVGRITRQMYDDILSSDFCIAVLHGFNPNVFYELAVAHSAGVPVILLSEKGIDPPFDLKDERLLHYDLGARSIFRGDNVRSLLEMIEGVRKIEKREVVFDPTLSPLGVSAVEPSYSLRNETNANAAYWLDLVRTTRQRLLLAGIGFTGWRGIPGMREALKHTAASGCDVRILTMDVQNPAFAGMLNPNVTAADPAGQAHGIDETRSWFKGAIGQAAAVRALRNGMLFQQIIVHDDKALVSPYLYSAGTGFSPCLKLDNSCPAFGSFLHEFEELWNSNA